MRNDIIVPVSRKGHFIFFIISRRMDFLRPLRRKDLRDRMKSTSKGHILFYRNSETKAFLFDVYLSQVKHIENRTINIISHVVTDFILT